MLDVYDIESAASVTRNPAIPRLMASGFHTVSPDLDSDDPLHHYGRNEKVRALTETYAEHIGASPADLPLVVGRYEGGLYGYDDPGRHIGIPELAADPESGIIMVATDRRQS